MATTTATTTLGTSNIRGASRQTRNNPTRTSRNNRPNLRQNSLISNPPPSTQGLSEPHGFYPAISHFTDGIAALPRDYRRHISLLKEVDAKAWLPEENLQNLLSQCVIERQTRPITSTAHTIAGSTHNAVDDAVVFSAANSVNGAIFDNVSQYSIQSADPVVLQRRQLYQSLRMNLMQMMVTMDEKNHVINNANEDLSRHVRRLDDIWPHISEEISDEARLGSLKHWAYTDLNPPKKVIAASTRREAASSLAMLVDTDIAHRSESRREAMLAKKQRLNQHVDSDFDDKAVGRKTVVGKGKKPEMVAEPILAVAAAGAGKRKKPERAAGGVTMERSTSALRAGWTAPMSREPSQQDNTKKRKAPITTAGTVARKRLNVTQQESPKLASSPLAHSHGKDAVKRSPALSTVRPVGRGRQNSAQTTETSKNRPSSSASHRNLTGLGFGGESEVKSTSIIGGKNTNEVKNTKQESVNIKNDRSVENNAALNGDSVRGGLAMERTSSNRAAKREAMTDNARSAPSPRSVPANINTDIKYSARGRASKTSTPLIGSFADADGDDSGGANGSENGIIGGSNSKQMKRAPRPRMKDHHGLHDSLSPKGLPMKRTHARNMSLSSFTASQTNSANMVNVTTANNTSSRPNMSRARNTDREEETVIRSTSRNHGPSTSQSQSTTSNAKAESDEGEDDEIVPDEEDELRYCYCNGVSYGEMVACDNKNCDREWFHLECIGLKSLPKSAKWYCDECKEALAKKGRFGSTGGNGNSDR